MQHEQPPLVKTLAFVFVTMVAVMFVYELAKQTINPDITLWESHAITILFTSIVSLFIVYFPLRSIYREQRKTRDVLDHLREAEEKLRHSKSRYQSFVESAEDSIYTVGPDLRYLLINTRHLARRGLSPEDVVGKQYGDFHTPEETERFRSRILAVTESKIPVQDEYEQDGKTYLRKLNPVTDAKNSRVIAVTVVSTDITDRKQAEKNLEMTNKKLNLMNDIIRHDVLNQLSALNSYLQLAGEQTQDIRVKKYLFRSEQVSDTIQSQILFARDYQTIGVESPQWQNIHATIQHARMSMKIANVGIGEDCSSMEIFADPLLEKVFYNLMDNALRYAGPSVDITFRCRIGTEGCTITCEDNGPGIPEDEKNRLFTRGFGKNTGLGLFLSREILSITGITIRETGDAGRGCRFEITVPEGAFRQSPPA